MACRRVRRRLKFGPAPASMGKAVGVGVRTASLPLAHSPLGPAERPDFLRRRTFRAAPCSAPSSLRARPPGGVMPGLTASSSAACARACGGRLRARWGRPSVSVRVARPCCAPGGTGAARNRKQCAGSKPTAGFGRAGGYWAELVSSSRRRVVASAMRSSASCSR